MNCDGILKAVLAKSRHMMVPYYLMSSYLYYVRDEPMLSDDVFDQLCKDLNAEWDDIAHRHKSIIDRGWLTAGTCMLARENYPIMTRNAACQLVGTVKLEPVDYVYTPRNLPRARVRTRAVQPVAT